MSKEIMPETIRQGHAQTGEDVKNYEIWCFSIRGK